MGTMEKLFRLMAEKKATDLFLSCGAPITIKMQGNSVPVNPAVLGASQVRDLIAEILSPQQMAELEEGKDLQTRTSVPDVGVFRLSCFFQRGTTSND